MKPSFEATTVKGPLWTGKSTRIDTVKTPTARTAARLIFHAMDIRAGSLPVCDSEQLFIG
jgi:hypothetical protein